MKDTKSFSSVSLIVNPQNTIDLPEDEVGHLMSRLVFSVDLINKQYNDSVLAIVLHLCWEDYQSSLFFISELSFSCQVHKANYSEFKKRLSIVKEILRLEDSLQQQRFEMVLGLNRQPQAEEGEAKKTEDITIFDLAQAFRNVHPYFTLKVIKIIADLSDNSTMLLYLTETEEKMKKIEWIRDFLDSIKLDENTSVKEKLKSNNLLYDIDSSSPLVDACIESFSQLFPEGEHGFRCFQEQHKKEEGYEAPIQINIQDDGIFGAAADEAYAESAMNDRGNQFYRSDDDFNNVKIHNQL